MRTFSQPRRGHCASCDGRLPGPPIFRRDETYCCLGCAENGPCICTYEQDLADDGVDHMGLPFLEVPVASPVADRVPARSR